MEKPWRTGGAKVFAATVLGIVLAVILGVLVFLLWRGGWPALVYAVAVAAIIAVALCFRLDLERRLNVALLILSLAFVLYSVEFVLAITATPGGVESSEGRDVDTRTRLQVVNDLRNAGVDAWLSVHPYLLIDLDGLGQGNNRLFPLSGISNTRTVYCNEGGEYVVFDSDEYGFNNPPGVLLRGGVELILVGDSFAQGKCVERGQDVASRLREQGIAAASVGMDGSGPLIELGLIQEYVLPFNPRVVVWMYYEGNDLGNLARERLAPTLLRYLEPDFSQDFLERVPETDAAWRAWVTAEIQERGGVQAKPRWVWPILKLTNLRSRLRLTRKMPPPSELFRRILSETKARVSTMGGKLYFAYLPDWGRFATSRTEDGEYRYRDAVLTLVGDLEIPVIDFAEGIATHGNYQALFPHRQGGHYNATGYLLLSEMIADRVSEGGFLPVHSDHLEP